MVCRSHCVLVHEVQVQWQHGRLVPPVVIHLIYGHGNSDDHDNDITRNCQLLKTHHVLSTLCMLFLLLDSLQHWYYYSHFTEEETEVQRGSRGS